MGTRLCSSVSEQLFTKYSIEKLSKLGNGQCYEICHSICAYSSDDI